MTTRQLAVLLGLVQTVPLGQPAPLVYVSTQMPTSQVPLRPFGPQAAELVQAALSELPGATQYFLPSPHGPLHVMSPGQAVEVHTKPGHGLRVVVGESKAWIDHLGTLQEEAH